MRAKRCALPTARATPSPAASSRAAPAPSRAWRARWMWATSTSTGRSPGRASASRRAEAVRAALALLAGEWRDRWDEALARSRFAGERLDLSIVETLLARLPEVAAPEPTVLLPGQQTETRW